jgi:hypothetical protein
MTVRLYDTDSYTRAFAARLVGRIIPFDVREARLWNRLLHNTSPPSWTS